MHNLALTNFTKYTFGPNLFFTNTFDEKFLEEKQFALSPIDLDDSIPFRRDSSIIMKKEGTYSKNLNNKLTISSEKILDKKKSKKSSAGSYGSNIVLISYQDQSEDSKDCPIAEQVNKLVKKDPQIFRYKKHNTKKKRFSKK